MKIEILRNPALRALVLASLVTIIGLVGFSISSYEKGGSFPLFLVVSEFVVGLGSIAILISLVAMAILAVLRLVSRNQHPAS